MRKPRFSQATLKKRHESFFNNLLELLERSVVKTATGPATEPQDFKKKYYDSLDALDGEKQKFRAMEAALKRLAGRLCIASMGQSAELDAEIKKLQTTIRRESTTEELDKAASDFTDAINKIDKPAAASASPSPAKVEIPPSERPGDALVDERVRAVLAAMLGELKRDPELLAKVEALDAKLAASIKIDQLQEVMSALADLVALRIQRIERAKQEIEVLLGHLMGKLDEIGQFIADQSQNRSQAQASSETLNVQLVGEMKAMGESVESAVDLSQIRTHVRTRLDTIGQHLQEFRQREATLSAAMQARTEQMQARMTELEAEAQKLQDQLKDEQRLATIDTLTKVPNRLSYEKRMEEELKRWQRFKQPTCLAVWDIDRFKAINDNYGHRAGDRVLRAVAECLAGRIRGTDFFARYGGEEFVMLLCGTKLDDAMRIVNEMREIVSKLKFHSQGTPLPVTISSGVTALLPNDTASGAFDRADKALYQAKEGGRNKCVSA